MKTKPIMFVFFVLVIGSLISLAVYAVDPTPIAQGIKIESGKQYSFGGVTFTPASSAGTVSSVDVGGHSFTISNIKYNSDQFDIFTGDGRVVFPGSSSSYTIGSQKYQAVSSGPAAPSPVPGVGSGAVPSAQGVHSTHYFDVVHQQAYTIIQDPQKKTVSVYSGFYTSPLDASAVPTITFPSTDSYLSKADWSTFDGIIVRSGQNTITLDVPSLSYTVEKKDGNTEVWVFDAPTSAYKLTVAHFNLGTAADPRYADVNYKTGLVDLRAVNTNLPAAMSIAVAREIFGQDLSKLRSVDQKLTATDNSGLLWFNQNQAYSINPNGNSIQVLTRNTAGTLVRTRETTIQEDAARTSAVLTTTEFDPLTQQATSGSVLRTFDGSKLRIEEKYTGSVNPTNLQHVFIQREGQQAAELSGSVYTQYGGSRFADSTYVDAVTQQQLASEILFAYTKLGDEGKFVGQKYTTQKSPDDEDYLEVVVATEIATGAHIRKYTQYDNTRPVLVEEEFIDAFTTNIAGQVITMNAGGRRITEHTYTSDGSLLGEKEEYLSEGGLLLAVKGQDSVGGPLKIYETSFDQQTGDRVTIYDGRTYGWESKLGLYSIRDSHGSDVLVGSYRFYVDTTNNPYLLVDGVPRRADTLTDSELSGLGVTRDQITLASKQSDPHAIARDKENEDSRQERQHTVDKKSPPIHYSPFGTVFGILGAYKPYDAVSNLLIGDEYMSDWRRTVDQWFYNSVLGGTDYWTSQICEQEFDTIGESVAALQLPGGIFQLLAHVEAERSEPVPLLCNPDGSCVQGSCRTFDNVCVTPPNQTIQQFFYKITYGVTAPSDQALTPYLDEQGAIDFNLVITGPEKTASLFTGFVPLKNGEVKKDVIVKYSSSLYTDICLIFGKKPLNRDGSKVDKICNTLAVSQKSFENFIQTGQAQGSSSGGVSYCSECW